MHSLVRVVAPLILAGATIANAFAADSSNRIVVTAFGGVWQQSIEKNFVPCFKEKTGKDVAIQLGDPAGWINRIRANPGHPPIDIVTLAPADTMRAIRAGMLEDLDKSKLPNLQEISPASYEMWEGKAVNIHQAALGVLYNKQAIPNPPKDWRTLLDNIAAGKYGKRVSMPSGTYTWGPEFIWFVGQTYEGDPNTGFEKLKGMMPSVVKFWTDPTEAINLFATKQVDILLYWDGRAYDFIEKGNSWAGYYNPAPKSLGTASAFAKVKNSPPAAWEFLNCAMSAKAQLGHAQTLGYGVTNMNVVYPNSFKNRITPTSDMVFMPYGKYLDSFGAWIDRWNREMR